MNRRESRCLSRVTYGGSHSTPSRPAPSRPKLVLTFGLWLLVVDHSKHHHQSLTRELLLMGATK